MIRCIWQGVQDGKDTCIYDFPITRKSFETKQRKPSPRHYETVLISLDADQSLAKSLEDTSAPDPAEFANFCLMRDALLHAIDSLRPRLRDVIKYRFELVPLPGNVPPTMQAIANHLGIGKERVSQIVFTALRMLRHPKRIRLLDGFLNDFE